MEFSRYYGKESDREALRTVTDEIIAEIGKLSGQEYVDIYAKRAKDQLQGPSAESDLPPIWVVTSCYSGSHHKIAHHG